MTPETVLLLAGAGLAAGAVNAIAGGGSLISFPALLAAGYPGVQANVTNTVALFPGYAGSVVAGRPELVGQGRGVRLVAATSVVGAVGGSVLLLTTPGDVFSSLAPFLILVACALLLLQPRLALLVRSAATGGSPQHRSPLLHAGVLAAAVYGAYFGAGLGVMLLGILGIFVAERLQTVNALKNLLSLLVNAVALVAFGLFGPVAWPAVLVIATTSLVGGYVGARAARRIPTALLRGAVVVYGLGVALVLLVRG